MLLNQIETFLSDDDGKETTNVSILDLLDDEDNNFNQLNEDFIKTNYMLDICFDEIDNSLHFYDMIQDKGISKEMIKVFDRHGHIISEESISADLEYGVFVVAEEAVIDKVKDAIKKFIDYVIGLFKKIMSWLSEQITAFSSMVSKSQKVLKYLYEKELKGAKDSDFDLDKMKKVEVRLPKKLNTVQAYAQMTDQLAKYIESIIVDIQVLIDQSISNVVNKDLDPEEFKKVCEKAQKTLAKYLAIDFRVESDNKGSLILELDINNKKTQEIIGEDEKISGDKAIVSPTDFIAFVDKYASLDKKDVKKMLTEADKFIKSKNKQIQTDLKKLASLEKNADIKLKSYKSIMKMIKFANKLAHITVNQEKYAYNITKLLAIKLAKSKKK